MIVVARDTSTARISTVLEVMLAKFPAACSGDVLSSYVMCVNLNILLKKKCVVHIIYMCKSMNLYCNLYSIIPFPIAVVKGTHMNSNMHTFARRTVYFPLIGAIQYIPAEFHTA